MINKSSPKISVLLPNLNSRKFIEERLQTIVDQTYQNWELIVVDAFSDDGSFGIIEQYAVKDPRFRLYQRPRDGIYPGINHGIELATGEYIYIATADDTMEPDCLEKMNAAMDRYPGCGICHCNLKIIDEKGNWLKGRWEDFLVYKFFGDLLHQKHIRQAPLDGLLHFGLGSPNSSLTQLLIRKDIFEKVGLFSNEWGSLGDYEWTMRADLMFDSVHIPEYLATWRVHAEQATSQQADANFFVKHIKMSMGIVKFLTRQKHPLAKVLGVHMDDLVFIYEFHLAVHHQKNFFRRGKFFFLLAVKLFLKQCRWGWTRSWGGWELRYAELLLKEFLPDYQERIVRLEE